MRRESKQLTRGALIDLEDLTIGDRIVKAWIRYHQTIANIDARQAERKSQPCPTSTTTTAAKS